MMLKKRFTNLNVKEKIRKVEKIIDDKKILYTMWKNIIRLDKEKGVEDLQKRMKHNYEIYITN